MGTVFQKLSPVSNINKKQVSSANILKALNFFSPTIINLNHDKCPVISFDCQKLESTLLDSSPGSNQAYLHANEGT